MTLSFSTTWPDRMGYLAGKPNCFIEKIWSSLTFETSIEYRVFYGVYSVEHEEKFGQSWNNEYPHNPKLHTIREDPHNRWKPGMDIHMVINNRTKDRFQFAPVIKCLSVQKIEIIHGHCSAVVGIDGKFFGEIWHHGLNDIYEYTNDLKQLAINDGFPSIEAFFQYFNEDFKGKLIRWTDLRY